MAKFVTPLVLGLGLLSNLAIVHAADSKDTLMAEKAGILAQFEKEKTAAFDQFEESKKQYFEAFNKAKEELAKVWDTPELSNKTKWVQYSKDNTVKRSVDFESGEVVVEVVGNNLSESEIDKIVAGQVAELETQTTSEAFKKDIVLEKTKAKPSKIEAKEKVLPDVKTLELAKTAKKSKFNQQNGLKVTRVSMAVPENKIAKRAIIYLPRVNEMSAKWNIEPELILAIIHTESHFNPMAQSHIPAYGLMQVVPTSAGKDVTKKYLGKAQLLTPDILFNPDYNIDIGTAYLSILDSQYLRKVNNAETRTYLAISAYNGGVGAVAKHISGKSSLSALAKKANTLEPETVYNSLVKKFPYKETRNYLKKVNSKKIYYAKMLKASSI